MSLVTMALLVALMSVTVLPALTKDVEVKGYTKKDGTVVKGYTKHVTDPDKQKIKGYTRADGTKVAGYERKKKVDKK